jgi:hypothetical protein
MQPRLRKRVMTGAAEGSGRRKGSGGGADAVTAPGPDGPGPRMAALDILAAERQSHAHPPYIPYIIFPDHETEERLTAVPKDDMANMMSEETAASPPSDICMQSPPSPK